MTQLRTEWDILVESAARSSERDAISFSALPFIAVPTVGSRNEGELVARYGEGRLALLRALDWFLARQVDVVNLSLAPRGDAGFDVQDPLQVATRALDLNGTVVVVAAGNDGPGVDTLQVLARAEWVIAVGATDNQGVLLKTSSRGVRGGPHPTVVAAGTDLFDVPFEHGTSFAAPRVAALAGWLKIMLVLAARDYEAARSDSWGTFSQPMPFPRIGIADTGAAPGQFRQGSALARLYLDRGEQEVPIRRQLRERDWYRAISDLVGQRSVALETVVTPTVVRRALSLAARRLPAEAPENVGAGYVSTTEVQEFLCRLTPSRWLELFGAPQELREAAEVLDERVGPIWAAEKIDALRDLFHGGVRPYVAKVT
jgi:Subtilase family